MKGFPCCNADDNPVRGVCDKCSTPLCTSCAAVWDGEHGLAFGTLCAPCYAHALDVALSEEGDQHYDLDGLILLYAAWQRAHGLTLGSADDHAYDVRLTDEQRAWIARFIGHWDDATQEAADFAVERADYDREYPRERG